MTRRAAPSRCAPIRRVLRLSLAACLLAWPAAAPAQQATLDSYVRYHRTFGEWTVLCGENRASGHRSCSLSAPPPRLDAAARTNELQITEPSAGAFAVTLRIRHVADDRLPVFLRVDANQAHATQIAGGDAVWAGPAARRVVDELRAGAAVVVRVHDRDGRPIDQTLPLTGFTVAHDTLRRVLRDQEILPR